MISASFGAKIAFTRPSGLEKIVGRHRILDGQTVFSYIDNDIKSYR